MAERDSKSSCTPLKNPTEARAFQSHISSHYRRWKRISRDIARLYETSRTASWHPAPEESLVNEHHHTSVLRKTPGIADTHKQELIDDGEERTLAAALQRHGNSLSLLMRVPKNGLRHDPFRSLPIPADGCVPLTIDYFLHEWAPEYDIDYASTGHGCPHKSLVFPLAMDHAVLLESLVAMCRVFWLIARDITWHTDAEYIKHQGRALALVQAKLSSEAFADNATLLAIVCLTSIELLASNFSAVVAHAHGLNMLVGRRKDMDSVSAISEYAKSSARAHGMLGDYIKTRTDESIQAGAQSPPHQSLAQPLSYPKHPFPASFCAKLSSLPNGFSELALSGSLSVQCICIISSLSRKIQRHAQTAMSSAEQTADIQVELDALKHFYAMAKSPMEDYLTNGLISFCNQYPDKTTRNPFFNIALKCFNSALSDREKLVGIWRQDCLVWVAVIIAGVLDICAEPLESRHVVLDSCLADFPKARDWGHLEQILRSFFWTDALGRHWKQCWKAAMRRRQTDTCSTIDPPSSPGNDAPLFPVATPTPNTLLGLQNTGLGRLLHDAHNLTKAFIQAKT